MQRAMIGRAAVDHDRAGPATLRCESASHSLREECAAFEAGDGDGDILVRPLGPSQPPALYWARVPTTDSYRCW